MKTRFEPARAILPLLLALGCVFTMTSCGARAVQDAQGSAPSVANTVSDATPSSRTAGEMRQISALSNFFVGENTGDAFYELVCTSNAWQNENVLILKTDYVTGEQTCLCQKSGCAHADKTCNAYLKSASGLKLAVTLNAIYLLYESQPTIIEKYEMGRTEEDYARQREMLSTQEEKTAFDQVRAGNRAQSEENVQKCSYIDEISLDGTQKRRLVEFPRNMNVSFSCTDGTFVYGSYYEILQDEGKDKIEGVWADLGTGEFGTYALNNASVVGTYQNKVIATQIASKQDLSQLVSTNPDAYMAAYQNAVYEYRAIDPFTGENEVVASLPTMKATFLFTANDRLYYKRFQEDMTRVSIEYIDFSTGESTVLLQDEAELAIGTNGILPIGPFHNATLQYVAAMQEGEMPYDSIFNLETGEIVEITLRDDSKSGEDVMPVPVAQTNDGRWLVMTVSSYQTQTGQARYALMDSADFLAGNIKVTEVKAYEISA